MKKILIILCLFFLVGCTKIDINEFDNIKYIKDNNKDITSVVVRKTTIGSNDCYNVDINEAYNAVLGMEITKKSNISVTDDYVTYVFNFKDETKQTISFEGEFLHYKNDNYTVSNFDFIELNEEDIVECEYSK